MMIKNIFLFDMDGVLLMPGGYHESLRSSLKRIGQELRFRNVELRLDQIARFESLSVTNEWDTLAICTALLLLDLWKTDSKIRLKIPAPHLQHNIFESPDFDTFLGHFTVNEDLPGDCAFDFIIEENTWLNHSQRRHLSLILHNCRNIYDSLTLPFHQETVLGSKTFYETYHLKPQLNIESYLLKHDKPTLTNNNLKLMREWLSSPGNSAGIMTNRPCSTPIGYISSPEAEMGVHLIGFEDIPMLGSGMLAWYAKTQRGLPEHLFLKPNPVHALGLLSMCTGTPVKQALENSSSLVQGHGNPGDWAHLDHTTIVVFEDSTKGFLSGLSAKAALSTINVDVELKLIGVSNQAVKRHALSALTDMVYSHINDINWNKLFGDIK